MNSDPAFPAPDAAEQQSGQRGVFMGMLLRDYFAAQALQGMLARHELEVIPSMFARDAYKIADAMLRERAK